MKVRAPFSKRKGTIGSGAAVGFGALQATRHVRVREQLRHQAFAEFVANTGYGLALHATKQGLGDFGPIGDQRAQQLRIEHHA
ncbi:MAG: hypothetical protein QM756_01625 [Polyangiaceae bacterium]